MHGVHSRFFRKSLCADCVCKGGSSLSSFSALLTCPRPDVCSFAKKHHLRLFREYVPADAGVTGDKTYVAKCVEIINPETIVVKKPDGSLQKLTLASIRQPRFVVVYVSPSLLALGERGHCCRARFSLVPVCARDELLQAPALFTHTANPLFPLHHTLPFRPKEGEERPKSYFDIPWMYEAREFMRKKMVGHKCTVTIDFVKPAADGFPEKQCATVMCDNV